MLFTLALSSTNSDPWFVAKYLAIVMVFLLVLFWGSQYIIKQKNGRIGKNKHINIKEYVRLSSDSVIYIVEAMGNRYLIAQNKNHITLLDKEKSFDASLEIAKEQSSLENLEMEQETDFLPKTREKKEEAIEPDTLACANKVNNGDQCKES